MDTSTTIVALATPQGSGAIGVIRLSGPHAIEITNRCFKGKDLLQVASHTIHYGFIEDNATTIDEVMVSVFRAPKSFTTEDSVEISFHGSHYIADQILQTLIKNGAVPAKAGEFTLRAFLNGRIDLTQAEAVADLIASHSKASHDIALHQMRGGFAEELKGLRTQLLNFVSLIELELDFSEEDVEFANRKDLEDLIVLIQQNIRPLKASFKYGNAIKNGISVAIIGKPNAGKSTLLNTLLNENRAIVSDIAGTTRDTIEEAITIEGYLFRFIDTAGLRDTTDEIEQIGVLKAKEKMGQANIIIHLVDGAFYNATDLIALDQNIAMEYPQAAIITTVNKSDQMSTTEVAPTHLLISAKQKSGIDDLKNKLVDIVNQLKIETNMVAITNLRHLNALVQADEAMNRVLEGLRANISGEFLSRDIKEALEALGDITGEVTNDEILGNIFGKFCIGK